MKLQRRHFLRLAAGAAVLPAALRMARAQQRLRRVGVLMGLSASDPIAQARLAAFREAFAELGWREGRTVKIEYRWSEGDIGRVRANASELAGLGLDVILAQSTPVTAALKQATRSTPIVFVVVNDPVAQGFVSSAAKPGGNITGFSFMDFSTVGKGMQLLKDAATGMTRVGFMFNPITYPYYDTYLPALLAAANKFLLDVTPLELRSETEIMEATTKFAAKPGSGLIAAPNPFITTHREVIIRLASQNRLPTIFGFREAVVEGGLMSYAPEQKDIFRRSAAYVDRILKGDRPSDLPVQSPTKFEFVINLKTARALGVTIPETLLATADEVID